MPTQTGELGVTFPDNTLQTTAAIAGAPGFGGFQNMVIYSSSTVWICPATTTRVRATVVGGGGGSSPNGEDTWVGGHAGYAIGIYTVVPGTSYSVTVGLGGRGEPGPSSGGTSSFSTFCSATGGVWSGYDLPHSNGFGSGGNIKNMTMTPPGGGIQNNGTWLPSYGLEPYLTGFNAGPGVGGAGIVYVPAATYGAGLGGSGCCGIGGAVILEY
jgi:hypothetical protein